MRRTGGPEVLAVEEVELSPLRAGEIRIRALASAVNHSDLEIRAGNWAIRREPRFPYVPGIEVVGDVVESGTGADAIRVGDRVWTTMQGLGGVRAERDGGYAEFVTVAASAVAPLPVTTDPVTFRRDRPGGRHRLPGPAEARALGGTVDRHHRNAGRGRVGGGAARARGWRPCGASRARIPAASARQRGRHHRRRRGVSVSVVDRGFAAAARTVSSARWAAARSRSKPGASSNRSR